MARPGEIIISHLPRSGGVVTDLLSVLGLDALEGGFDLLRHEMLHTLKEPDGNNCEDDEGNNACPGEAIGMRILPPAGLVGGGQDLGISAWDVGRCQFAGVQRLNQSADTVLR